MSAWPSWNTGRIRCSPWAPVGTKFEGLRFHLEGTLAPKNGEAVFEAVALGNRWVGEIEVDVLEHRELPTRVFTSFAIGDRSSRELNLKMMPNTLGGAVLPVGASCDALSTDLELCLGFIEHAENTHESSLLQVHEGLLGSLPYVPAQRPRSVAGWPPFGNGCLPQRRMLPVTGEACAAAALEP